MPAERLLTGAEISARYFFQGHGCVLAGRVVRTRLEQGGRRTRTSVVWWQKHLVAGVIHAIAEFACL
jgi:hypothetical protein